MVGRETRKPAFSAVSRTALRFTSLLIVLLAIIAASSFVHAADAPAEETLLATLAANMIVSAGTSDYTLDCGPKSETVITTPTDASSLHGEYYCIMQVGGATRFGTFGPLGTDTAIASKDLLGGLEDPRYAPHIPVTDIDPEACSGFDPEAGDTFQECPGAIKSMHTYVYDADGDDTMFIIVSTNSVSAFANSGFLSGIVDFFKGLFGMSTQTSSAVETTDRFHHGYFAHVHNRNVTAQWYDDTAIIVYQNFVTDFSKEKPAQAEYLLGHNRKQVLRLTSKDGFVMSVGSAESVSLWRKLTSGLRITAASGTPIEGDVCGDGKVGFDEQCEPGKEVLTCQQYAKNVLGDPKAFGAGNTSCYPASDANGRGCTWDTGACVSCQDNDGDKFFAGQGISGGALNIVAPFSLGTATPYGTFNPIADALEIARTKSFPLASAVIPVTYDLAYPKGSTAESMFNEAVTGGGGSLPNTWYNKSNVKLQAARAAAISNIMKQQATARPCTLEASRLICPDGYSLRALGITNSTGSILAALKARNVAPVIRITLGTCADNTCGPYGHDAAAVAPWNAVSGLPTKGTYTAAELTRVELYCGVVADSVGTYWASITSGSGTALPRTFIVMGDPAQANVGPDAYNALYGACRKGVHDALGNGAIVLYALPPVKSDSISAYANKIIDPAAYDGVYIEPRIIDGKYEDIGSVKDFRTAMTSISSLPLSKYARGAIVPSKSNLYGTLLLAQHAATSTSLLYDTMGNRMLSEIGTADDGSAVENVTNITRYWLALTQGLTGTLYEFNKLPKGADSVPMPAGVIAFLAQTTTTHSTITIMNFNSEETKVPLNVSACTVEKVTNLTEDGARSTGSTAVYTGSVPGSSITTIALGSGVQCIVGTGALGSCGGAVDCSDTDPTPPIKDAFGVDVKASTTYPGAPERCASGVDYNCDGAKPNAPPGCTVGPITPPPTFNCDYNGVCAASEDQNQCWDCVLSNYYCPVAPKVLKTFGPYEVSVKRSPDGRAQAVIRNKNWLNFVVQHWSDHDANTSKYNGVECNLIAQFESKDNCNLRVASAYEQPVITIDFTENGTATYPVRGFTMHGANHGKYDEPCAWYSSYTILPSNDEYLALDWDDGYRVVATRSVVGGVPQIRIHTVKNDASGAMGTNYKKCWESAPNLGDGETLDFTIKATDVATCHVLPSGTCQNRQTPPTLVNGVNCAVDADCCYDMRCSWQSTCETPSSGGGGGGGCFIGSTLVRTPSGERAISSLREGDRVLSYDTVKQRTISATVSLVKAEMVTELIILTPQDMPAITTTPVHPFWTRRGWLEAGNLLASDEVFTAQGEWRPITIERRVVPPTPVYNIHVDDVTHNFYAGGVLVHNKADSRLPGE